MPNYMKLIGEHYPAVGATCDGDTTDYDNITWVDGDPLPTQADLDDKDLIEYQETKILELSASCAYEIVNGFESDAAALHTVAKWYDSQPEDQVNLVGSVTVGDDMLYPCRDVQDGTKNYVQHTHTQLEAVLRDGRDVKLSRLQNFSIKKRQVRAANSKAAVDLVTW